MNTKNIATNILKYAGSPLTTIKDIYHFETQCTHDGQFSNLQYS